MERTTSAELVAVPAASPAASISPASASLTLSPAEAPSVGSAAAEEETRGVSPPLPLTSVAAAGGVDAPPRPDAKSSALKALAGINRVVSRSRKVDADALQAIKAQRAKVKAEGGHRHSRTLSSDSLPALPELSALSPALTAHSTGGATASSGSGSISAGPGPTPGVPLPLTSPHAYSDWLVHRTLPELLALQSAVDAEISRQLGAVPAAGGDAFLSTQYAAALLVAQRQQQQEHAAALQQALAEAAAAGGSFDGGARPYAAGLPNYASHSRSASNSQMGFGGAQHSGGSQMMGTLPPTPEPFRVPTPSAAQLAFSGGHGREPFRSHAASMSLDGGREELLGRGGGGGDAPSRLSLDLDAPPDHLLGDLSAWLDEGAGRQSANPAAHPPPQSQAFASPFNRASTSLPPRPQYGQAAPQGPPYFGARHAQQPKGRDDFPSLFGHLRLQGGELTPPQGTPPGSAVHPWC